MAFRPDFQNPWGRIGQGIERAAQQVGSFFARRADQNYQQGLSAIAEAKAEKKRLDAIRGNPQLELSAEEQAQLNALYEYYQGVETAHPLQAMQMAEQGPPGGTKATTFTKNVVTARPGLEQVEAGTGKVQEGATEAGTGQRAEGRRPQPQTEQRRVTERTPIPAGQFVAGLERRARLGEQAREERLLDEEREFVLRRDKQGQDVEIRTTQLQNAAALQRAGMETESRELVAQIAADNNLDVAELQGEIDQEAREYDWTQRFNMTDLEQAHQLQVQGKQAAYDAMLEDLASSNRVDEMHVRAAIQQARDERLFEQQLEFTNLESALTEAERLKGIASDTSLPRETREAAASALNDVSQSLPRSYQGIYGSQATQNLLAVEDEEARRGRQATVDKLEEEAELTHAQAEALRSEVVVDGARVRLYNAQADGEQILNERRQFENEAGRITAAHEYVERAINSGMPGYLQELQEEAQNPGTHPHLTQLAQQIGDPSELDAAIEQAHGMESIRSREQDVVRQQLTQQEFTSRAETVNAIGGAFDVEDIERMHENGAFASYIEQGVLSEADVAAMKGAASHRQVIEQNERDGPRLEMLNDRLWRYADMLPRTDEERTAVANGVNSVTGRLQRMGYMSQDEANALRSAFERQWTENVRSTDLQNELTRLQMQQARHSMAMDTRRAEAAEAEAAAAGEGGGLDPSALNAYRGVLQAREDNIWRRAEQDGCVGGSENERIMSDGMGRDSGQPCSNYLAELNVVGKEMTNLGTDTGAVPEGVAEQFGSDLDLIEYLGSIPATQRTTVQDQLYSAAVERQGGEEAVMQKLQERQGVPPEGEEEAPTTSGGIRGNVTGVVTGERSFRPGIRQFWTPAFGRNAPASLEAVGVSRQEFQQDLQRVENASGFGGMEEARRIAGKYGLLTPGSVFTNPGEIAQRLRSRFGE